MRVKYWKILAVLSFALYCDQNLPQQRMFVMESTISGCAFAGAGAGAGAGASAFSSSFMGGAGGQTAPCFSAQSASFFSSPSGIWLSLRSQLQWRQGKHARFD